MLNILLYFYLHPTQNQFLCARAHLFMMNTGFSNSISPCNLVNVLPYTLSPLQLPIAMKKPTPFP